MTAMKKAKKRPAPYCDSGVAEKEAKSPAATEEPVAVKPLGRFLGKVHEIEEAEKNQAQDPAPTKENVPAEEQPKKKVKKSKASEKEPETPGNTDASTVAEDDHVVAAAVKQDEPTKKVKTVEAPVDENLPDEDPAPYPYEADVADHFETPREAYQDLKSILDFYIKQTHNRCLLGSDDRNAKITIYDPYYCKGNAKRKLTEVMNSTAISTTPDDAEDEDKVEGEEVNEKTMEKRKKDEQRHTKPPVEVVNQKRDFYKDLEEKNLPKHDILVTNPPFSADHKNKLFDYIYDEAVKCEKEKRDTKPWCVLLPSWTCSKKFYRRFLFKLSAVVEERKNRVKEQKKKKKAEQGKKVTDSSAGAEQNETKNSDDASSNNMKNAVAAENKFDEFDATSERKAEVFYIAPRKKYEFQHDFNASNTKSAPFFGLWICGGFKNYTGYADKFGGKKLTLDLKGLQDQKLARTREDVQKRQELNPNQKWRAEKFGGKNAKGNGKGKAKGVAKGQKGADSSSQGGKAKAGQKGVKKDNDKKATEGKGTTKIEAGKVEATKSTEAVPSTKEASTASTPAAGTAAPKVDKANIICRHFQSAAGCSRGDKCKFRHVKADAE
ncbi:unnamed protein product [Amoebophrya sp. A120]|nr:unnamed protein product [Amoebophrya sp. A120]|eukprot:GSA120T00004209001.1